MLCGHCHKRIIHKRTLWNFFDVEIHSLCESCYARYPLLPTYEVIPIETGILELYTLITKKYPVDPMCYQSFLATYYVYFLQKKESITLLIFDIVSKDSFDLLDQLSFGNLMVVRLYENMHEKGEKL